nr:capsid protein [Dromedary astrovirus]
MANRQQKRQPRTTTNIVVRNGTAANQAGPSQARQARRRRNRRKPQVNIRLLSSQNKAIRRVPRRQGVGSRVVFQKINSTLGTVGSNGSEQIECEMTCLMNPATMKEATGSNSFTPLGIYASTYSLFRMTRCTVTLKPLVGDSAVSGTVIRVSWNPTSTPTQTSWSALGARKHIDVTPGKTGRFTLTARDLVGPKGGWFKTNTKGDPMMSFAGTIEIHTLGKTMSTYTNTEFNGGLFLAELETQWQFKDYAQQPGMLNLIKGEDKSQARVEVADGGKLQLVVPGNSRMARASGSATSEIIWLVTDTIIQAGTSLLGPFGWLIRGGWWLVKRAANAPVRRDGSATFDIYASISDARANMPCITDQQDVNIPVGGLHFQQVTPGNTGIGDDITTTRSIGSPVMMPPTKCFVTAATMLKLSTTGGVDNTIIPSYCAWYNIQGTQNNSTGVGFEVNGAVVATYNIRKVNVVTDVGLINLSQFENTIPVNLYYNNTHEEIGLAVAGKYDHVDQSPHLWLSTVLFCATKSQAYQFTQSWSEVRIEYPVSDYMARTRILDARNGTVRIKVDQGEWYTAQFFVRGTIDHQYKVGDLVIASRPQGSVPTDTTTFTPREKDASSGLITSYASVLDVFTTSNVVVDEGRSVPLELEPSFGFDDALEEPYHNQDEEDDDGDPENPAGFDWSSDLDDEMDLEMGACEHYSDPPLSRLVVREEARAIYEQLRAIHSERAARLAANQLFPSDEYTDFTEVYHDALADGLSPREARAQALGY